MRRLLEQFNSSNSTSEQRLSILTELEYLVHQVTHTHRMMFHTVVNCPVSNPACMLVCVLGG